MKGMICTQRECEDSLLTSYIVYSIVNGVINLAYSKISEKRIFEEFDNIKLIKTNKFKGVFTVPEELKRYANTIERKVNKENLNNFYNNLSSIKVNNKFSLLSRGSYDVKDNVISFCLADSLGHEGLHAASGAYDIESDTRQVGFSYSGKNLRVGKAINEGYTDLLNRRLFNRKTPFYNGEARIANFVELIVGSEKMEKYYFNNDLISLVNELGLYMGKREALKFILLFDNGMLYKIQANPIYKEIYIKLELMLCNIFENAKKGLLSQVKYVTLLDTTPITKTIHRIAK